MQPMKKDQQVINAKKSVRVKAKEIADSSESDQLISTCLQVSKVAKNQF